MRVLIVGVLLGVALTFFAGTPIRAADCEFRLGFKALRDLIGHDIVGECLENEFYNAIGDSNQHTTGGLMAWRKADNWTAFTDGYRTWINGPNGLEQRLNTERFPWEADYAPGGGIAIPTPVPRVIESELSYVLEVLTFTPIGRTLRAWFDEVSPSLTYGAASGGWTSFYYDPPRNEIIVRHELRNESADIQAAVIAWQTVIAINTRRYGLKSERWGSAVDCLAEAVVAEQAMAQWWFERFGAGGLRNASTGLESWLNTQAQRYQDNTLAAYVESHSGYRDWCAQYGQLPTLQNPTPTPTPMPRAVVDPILARALESLRRTEVGRGVVNEFYRLGASAVFEDLDDSDSWWQPSPRRVVIDISFRQESSEVLANRLIWPITQLSSYVSEGEVISWEECMSLVRTIKIQSTHHWFQAFGRNGKRNPKSDYEENSNDWLDLWIKLQSDELLAVWISLLSDFRDYCEFYGESRQSIDSVLAEAVRWSMLAGNLDIGRGTAAAILITEADVIFGSLSQYVHGQFRGAENRIVINQTLSGQHWTVLAAVLIHETYHAYESYDKGHAWQETPAACLQEEVSAFRLEASWWYEYYGRGGKRNPATSAERFNNALMWAWLNDGLREYVLLSEGYQEQCLGGVVN